MTIAGLYLLFAWLLQSSTISTAGPATDGVPASSLMNHLAGQNSLGAAVSAVLDTAVHTPSVALLVLLLVGGLFGFADVKNPGLRFVTGLLHTAVHLLLATLLMWSDALVYFHVLPRLFGSGSGEFLVAVGHVGFATVLGGILGGMLIGLYLVLMNRLFGVHTNEVFSCQHIPHYKNVLRLHVGDDGEVTIYPIGVPTVETNWELQSEATPPQAPWFDAKKPPSERAELIEPPVRVR